MLNRSETTMLMMVMNPPADTPWRERPTMSMAMLLDKAHTMELPKYRATPSRRIGFLPHMSESLAHTGLQALVAMTYEAPIHE
jgi:hypothetical protein